MYFYELIDNGGDVAGGGYDNYGMFFDNGLNGAAAAKPAATAFKNLISIMSDTSSTFTLGTLPYSVAGLPAYNGSTQGGGYSLLFQKSNGRFEIIVWNEPVIYNESTNSPVTPTAVPVTVNLGGTHGTVNVYDPLVGTTPITTLSNVSSVPLSLVKDPFIVEVIN